MVKYKQKLVQVSPSEFTIVIEEDSAFPNLGDNPVWSYFTEDAGPHLLGHIPLFLSYNDPRSAIEQLNEAYSHAGGWLPISGFRKVGEKDSINIQYPGDPILSPLACTWLRDEFIAFYPGAWVGVFNDNGTFQVARLN